MGDVLSHDVTEQIAQLKPRCREIVLLRYEREMKVNDIADMLHISQPAVSKWIGKARQVIPSLPRFPGRSLDGARRRDKSRPVA